MAPVTNQQRKFLKEISDELTGSDVGSMKFVCRDKLGAAMLEKVENDKPFQLFQLLEQKLLISAGDLSYLRGILVQIQRFDLVKRFPSVETRQDVVDSGAMTGEVSTGSAATTSVISSYRCLLKELADELTSTQVDEIKFLLNVPGGRASKITCGESLLTHMENEGLIAENKLAVLKDVFQSAHRNDLVTKVEKFLGGSAQEAPLPQQMPSLLIATQEESSPCYSMGSPRGKALIISVKKFSGRTAEGFVLNERKGTNVDVTNLRELWKTLGFEVELHLDLKAHQIVTVVQDMAVSIDRSTSCFVCCIMTHGKMGNIYGSDSKPVAIGTITGFFKASNCPALAGKPKLFFIQACRGQNKLISTESSSHVDMPRTNLHPDALPVEIDNEEEESTLRHHADPHEPHFLLGYSTPPGYVSFRSTQHGSWYMSALVINFSKYHENEDVLSMMIRVNAQVSDAYTSQGYKQCPAPVVTLTKKVYLKTSLT